MKVCARCGDNKNNDDFHFRSDRKGKLQSYCKRCFDIIQMRRWNSQKIQAINYLGGKCIDCPSDTPREHPVNYDFHHKDPSNKDMDWTKMRTRSFDKIKKELDKCVLLCVRHHRIRHIDPDLWP